MSLIKRDDCKNFKKKFYTALNWCTFITFRAKNIINGEEKIKVYTLDIMLLYILHVKYIYS